MNTGFFSSLAWKILVPVPAATAVVILSLWFVLPSVIAENVRHDAASAAQKIVNQYKTIRGYYTDNVVKKVLADGNMKVSETHKEDAKAIPLPATFIHNLSELLAKEDTTINLYSGYPFPGRASRTLDTFQRDAWEHLRQNPTGTFVRQEQRNGREWVRVGVPDVMVAKGCVDCHNNSASSPKKDWKLGDVRGVLEVATLIEPQLAAGAALSRNLVIGGLLCGLALIGIAIATARSVTKPITRMTGVMTRIAQQDLSAEIDGSGRRDEIGEMARTVEVFKRNAIEIQQMESEKVEQARRTEAEKKAAMSKLADDFEARVSGIVDSVSSQSTEMRSTAESMSATAEETSRQATAVAAAAEQASANVQTVASATEEMSASIGEINRQVGESVDIASRANHEAERTNETVQGLAAAADKIGEIVNLIREVAEQTNLLALNATIEAARAGEAGKGFAVVASEVKSLANQTAKATEEIASQINNMQSVSGEAVTAIASISRTIGEIGGIAQTISAAVAEQGTATQEIAANTQQASAGTQEVSSNVAGVTQAATETGAAAQQVLSAAGELSKQSETLRAEVSGFLTKIRAA